ncbi:hypothetical protein HDZ31DRAFT_22233, partial [Schizophyllum fasciatum]
LRQSGGLLHPGLNGRPFSTKASHQPPCPDVLHIMLTDELARANRWPWPLVRYCVNVHRQTVLCRADLTLESIRVLHCVTSTMSDVMHVFAEAIGSY